MEYERPYVSCDYEGCIDRAVVKRKYNGTNKAFSVDKKCYNNLCVEHYNLQNEEESLKWCSDNDLKEIHDRKKYVFETPFKFKRI